MEVKTLSLKEDGVEVVPNVTKRSEEFVSRLWDWAESRGTGIRKGDKKTQKSKDWFYGKNGIIEYPCGSHEQVVWDVRCEEGVIQSFAKVHGTEELVTSYDRINISRPGKKFNAKGEEKKQKNWAHTDQKANEKFNHVQGYVNLIESESDDGGLVVLPGSHKYFKEFHETFPGAKGLLTPEQYDWYLKKGLKPVKVNAPAGSLVLWDSRTVHWNYMPVGERYRMVVYVCMTPARLLDEKNRKKKQKAFKELRATKHSPHQVYLFPKKPRTWGKDLSKWKVTEKAPVITKRGLQLAGLVKY